MPNPKLEALPLCLCGSGQNFGICCAPLLAGTRKAATAEQLMRSRYCAFVYRDADYLLSTLASEKSSGFDADQVRADCCEWLELEIIATNKGGIFDQTGTVEFVARFRDNGREHVLHEISRFERRNGRWLYIDGEFPEADPRTGKGNFANVGRNAPCPCGSGKKHKKCCG